MRHLWLQNALFVITKDTRIARSENVQREERSPGVIRKKVQVRSGMTKITSFRVMLTTLFDVAAL